MKSFFRRFSRGLIISLVGGLALALSHVGVSAGEAEATAAPLLLASVLPAQTDVSQYWVSEKLDGVRAHWDGSQLRFRSGRSVAAPAWFVERFPKQALDGELWLARGEFDRLSGIVRKQQPDDAEWRQVRYMLFELPDAPGSFSQLIEQMRAIVEAADIPWLQVVEQFRVKDRAQLQASLENILQQRGEGLMLHLADAPYVTGRSDVLFKLKPWLDAEAKVVEHLPGKGRYQGQLGALRLEMPNGQRFNLGTGFTDTQRRNPPAIGSLVSYRYRELNANGIPRFASYLRVRERF